MTDLQTAIREKFQAASRILIASHVRPDGDAIGSLLALGLALQDSGKTVQMVLADGVPATFRHLPGSDQIVHRSEGAFDLAVTVDCSDLKRVGSALDGYGSPDIVIDHHVTTEPFGILNLVEPEAVATASVLIRYMPAWGLVITPPIAASLMTGLVTDTLGFRTSNITSEALRQAADLLDLGVDMSALYFRSLVRRTFAAARYWGAGLSSLEQANGIVSVTMTLADRKSAGYTGNDDADLINVVSSIDANEVAIIFVEQNAEHVKVSWRGLKPEIDVARIAKQFGGGGHRAAAGAEVRGGLDEVRERVLRITRRALNDM
ncbi:MAG: DHH family phosphoesterase [Anaerolineales bacterium]|nr:DHH family phosphoesterase [Anaerolineales bacterium]